MSKLKIWFCKIGEVSDDRLPDGADGPMRSAVMEAYQRITGQECDFCFSGWGAELDRFEKWVLNKQEPPPDAAARESAEPA